MKNLFLTLIAVVTLSSCSKNIITTDDVTVTVEKQSASHDEHIVLVINAEYTPKTFGENIEAFTLDVIITATNGYEQVNETVTIHSSEFVACRDKVVYGRGHQFAPIIPRSEQGQYTISYEYQVR